MSVRRFASVGFTAALAILGATACGSSREISSERREALPGAGSDPVPSAEPRSVARGSTPTRRIVALGDSLTAGLGLPMDQSYPALLQQRLNDRGLDYQVVNAGVSGDTSAGGLRRLTWALEGDVRVLIVALGGNDGLRGLPPPDLKRNLAEIIERARARGVTVVLAGMEAPPNYGQAYISDFNAVYPALARQYRVALVPFLLQGVAGNETLNQPDGIHPTAKGARVVAENIWSVLQPIVEGHAAQ